MYNNFSQLSYVPYNIVMTLAQNNENIFKILKYNTYDCLTQPNLSFEEKMGMIYKNQDQQQDYRIFLNPLVENMQYDATTIMKCFRYDSWPKNHLLATVVYEFDILFGDKIAMIDYNGIPCNRADVMETEIMKTLNGTFALNGVGAFQFNAELSQYCRSRMVLNNTRNYNGCTIFMAMQIGSIDEGRCFDV